MKTYFYSIATEQASEWSAEKQYKVTFENWLDFVNFCLKIVESQNTVVRGCESEGYNNQGYYFEN